jgi:DNA primase
MDIDNRSFIDVMKDLASQTGIELPKDNQDSKKLTYKKTITPTPVNAIAPVAPAPTPDHIQDFEPYPFPQDDPFLFADQQFAEITQEGNLYDLLENIAQFYQQQLPKSASAQRYFKQRGLSPATIQDWRLGYAPEDWQHLEQAFPQDIDGLKQLGLIRTSDSGRDFDLLRDRVIFPIRDPKGRVVGFGGRALNDEIKPKYINSPDSEVFHKNQLLYGLYEDQI